MLLLHAIKHPSNVIAQGFRSVRAGSVLELDFFDISVQGAFVFRDFAERLNLLDKQRVNLAGDWFLFC